MTGRHAADRHGVATVLLSRAAGCDNRPGDADHNGDGGDEDQEPQSGRTDENGRLSGRDEHERLDIALSEGLE